MAASHTTQGSPTRRWPPLAFGLPESQPQTAPTSSSGNSSRMSTPTADSPRSVRQGPGFPCTRDDDCQAGLLCRGWVCECSTDAPVKIQIEGVDTCLQAKSLYESCLYQEECSHLNANLRCVDFICYCPQPLELQGNGDCLPAKPSLLKLFAIATPTSICLLIGIGGVLGVRRVFLKRRNGDRDRLPPQSHRPTISTGSTARFPRSPVPIRSQLPSKNRSSPRASATRTYPSASHAIKTPSSLAHQQPFGAAFLPVASVLFQKTSSNRAMPAPRSATRFVQKLPPSGQDNSSEDSEDIIKRVQNQKSSKPSGTTATASKTPHGLIGPVPVAAAISFPHEEEESSVSLQWGISVKSRSKRQAAAKEPARIAARSARKASAGLAEEGIQSCPTTSSAPRNSRGTGFLDDASMAEKSTAVLLKTTGTPTDAGVSVTRSGSANEPCLQTALVQSEIAPTSYQNQRTSARAPNKDGILVTIECKEDCSAGSDIQPEREAVRSKPWRDTAVHSAQPAGDSTAREQGSLAGESASITLDEVSSSYGVPPVLPLSWPKHASDESAAVASTVQVPRPPTRVAAVPPTSRPRSPVQLPRQLRQKQLLNEPAEQAAGMEKTSVPPNSTTGLPSATDRPPSIETQPNVRAAAVEAERSTSSSTGIELQANTTTRIKVTQLGNEHYRRERTRLRDSGFATERAAAIPPPASLPTTLPRRLVLSTAAAEIKRRVRELLHARAAVPAARTRRTAPSRSSADTEQTKLAAGQALAPRGESVEDTTEASFTEKNSATVKPCEVRPPADVLRSGRFQEAACPAPRHHSPSPEELHHMHTEKSLPARRTGAPRYGPAPPRRSARLGRVTAREHQVIAEALEAAEMHSSPLNTTSSFRSEGETPNALSVTKVDDCTSPVPARRSPQLRSTLDTCPLPALRHPSEETMGPLGGADDDSGVPYSKEQALTAGLSSEILVTSKALKFSRLPKVRSEPIRTCSPINVRKIFSDPLTQKLKAERKKDADDDESSLSTFRSSDLYSWSYSSTSQCVYSASTEAEFHRTSVLKAKSPPEVTAASTFSWKATSSARNLTHLVASGPTRVFPQSSLECHDGLVPDLKGAESLPGVTPSDTPAAIISDECSVAVRLENRTRNRSECQPLNPDPKGTLLRANRQTSNRPGTSITSPVPMPRKITNISFGSNLHPTSEERHTMQDENDLSHSEEQSLHTSCDKENGQKGIMTPGMGFQRLLLSNCSLPRKSSSILADAERSGNLDSSADTKFRRLQWCQEAADSDTLPKKTQYPLNEHGLILTQMTSGAATDKILIDDESRTADAPPLLPPRVSPSLSFPTFTVSMSPGCHLKRPIQYSSDHRHDAAEAERNDITLPTPTGSTKRTLMEGKQTVVDGKKFSCAAQNSSTSDCDAPIPSSDSCETSSERQFSAFLATLGPLEHMWSPGIHCSPDGEYQSGHRGTACRAHSASSGADEMSCTLPPRERPESSTSFSVQETSTPDTLLSDYEFSRSNLQATNQREEASSFHESRYERGEDGTTEPLDRPISVPSEFYSCSSRHSEQPDLFHPSRY